ncbi:uncharacterized protein LOC117816825 isoform X3 [Notolabrus celidotus]|uniref:uncharacterized protein LOC117816825 isoform X3 n=1 Tax=Notolabrus celidotus TaxID=1203425 RepID=UPI00148F5331|nr:uncharacterized protein LOC117816825 isoform X3 [Notolabrus celidotus]
MAPSRHMRRLQKLKAHHDVCEKHYEKTNTKEIKEQRESTLVLHGGLDTTRVYECSSDSDSTIILDHTTAKIDVDTSVPELRRTDSVVMIGYTTDDSLSISEFSGDEYVPETSEDTGSDTSAEDDRTAEDVKQHKDKKRKALRNLSEAKWNAPQLLPFAEDVKKMHEHLNVQRKDCQTKLQQEPNKKHWAELAKMTLCEVILFNRRREGEVSKMPLNGFLLRDTSTTHPDVELALSDFEKKLCKHFQRIEIKGKRGRKVPILLTPDMMTSMNLLVKTRQNCDVPDENPFLFARPQALSHFRGSDVIRHIAQSCGASHPEALSSTKLRKHMATMSKVLNLKDNEMDDLADFLGHDIRVHRQYYRLPEGTLQLAKVSKVLMAMEQGRLAEFKGRNLDEINIDPQETMAVDSDASVSEEDDMTVKDAASSTSSSPSTSLSEKSGVKRKSTTEVGRIHDPREVKVTVKPTRQKWTEEEIQAVEKTLMDCISSGTVPGKARCLQCIDTSQTALKRRSWEGVKFYVKNRIDAAKRESMKKR